tara:strand:- start:318 stop:473 length:156 start_codon:yes stop_codon:yes gene_type:complete
MRGKQNGPSFISAIVLQVIPLLQEFSGQDLEIWAYAHTRLVLQRGGFTLII